jgi:hypothetical protein
LIKVDEQEMVIDRGVSRTGLHLVHVMRAGEKVDAEGWMRREAPAGARVWSLEYKEEALEMWHFLLWWKKGEDDDER